MQAAIGAGQGTRAGTPQAVTTNIFLWLHLRRLAPLSESDIYFGGKNRGEGLKFLRQPLYIDSEYRA